MGRPCYILTNFLKYARINKKCSFKTRRGIMKNLILATLLTTIFFSSLIYAQGIEIKLEKDNSMIKREEVDSILVEIKEISISAWQNKIKPIFTQFEYEYVVTGFYPMIVTNTGEFNFLLNAFAIRVLIPETPLYVAIPIDIAMINSYDLHHGDKGLLLGIELGAQLSLEDWDKTTLILFTKKSGSFLIGDDKEKREKFYRRESCNFYGVGVRRRVGVFEGFDLETPLDLEFKFFLASTIDTKKNSLGFRDIDLAGFGVSMIWQISPFTL